MEVIATDIPGVLVLCPRRHRDHRGFFSEVFNGRAMRDAGVTAAFVQDNQSLSVEAGVLRGLHYQVPPLAQDKLVRVTRGSILDVAVDVRRNSPTFGRHARAVLSAENWRQIYVPAGFAHGFVTLEPDTEVIYNVSADCSPAHERGVRWDDPALGIDWGVDPATAILSARDREHPRLADVPAGDLF